MKNELSYSVKTILNFYDLCHRTDIVDFKNYHFIRVWLDFTPKNISEITPSSANTFDEWKICLDETKPRIIRNDSLHITKHDMPIIPYLGVGNYADHEFNSYCQNYAVEILNDILKTYGLVFTLNEFNSCSWKL